MKLWIFLCLSTIGEIYKTFLDILKLKMLHILKLDRWFFVADTYLDYRIVFWTGFGDVMNFFHGLNGLTRVSRHLSAAEGGVSLMEAAHSQHVSLLSQRIKLAYILSATRINHYLPLYKPAVERSTLCTVHFPQNWSRTAWRKEQYPLWTILKQHNKSVFPEHSDYKAIHNEICYYSSFFFPSTAW